MACTTAGIQIIIMPLAFTVFSFLPNWNVLPSTFWQWSSPTVGCIPANKPSIASCFHVPWPCSVFSPGTIDLIDYVTGIGNGIT